MNLFHFTSGYNRHCVTLQLVCAGGFSTFTSPIKQATESQCERGRKVENNRIRFKWCIMSKKQYTQSDIQVFHSSCAAGQSEPTVELKDWSQCGKKVTKVCTASLLNHTVFDETDYARPAAPVFANNSLRQDVTPHRLKSKCQDLSYSWLLN